MSEAKSLKRYIAQAIDSAESLFERLVFLGSLRDAYTGRYLHEGWSGVDSAEEIHKVLSEFHNSVFVSVLRFSLIDLTRELRRHFSSLNQTERETALFWLEIEPFRDLIPEGSSPWLRELFISQVRTALEVLSRAPDWPELMGPAALPHSPPDQSLLRQWTD